MKLKTILWGLGTILAIAAILAGPIMSRVEQAKYTVVEKQGKIEIRDYAPTVVAEVDVTGPRKKAISEGFRMIADYIFGNNAATSKISMTAPVMQQLGFVPDAPKSPKLTPGAPQPPEAKQAFDAWGMWKVRFVMPGQYTLGTLPKPASDAIHLKEVNGARYVAIRFAGLAENDSLRERTEQLNAFITAKNLKAMGQPTYAFYNPPWTLSPFRRNEVLIEVAK